MPESLNASLVDAQRKLRTFLTVVLAGTEAMIVMQRQWAKERLMPQHRGDALRRLDQAEAATDAAYRDAIAAADELLVSVAGLRGP